MVVELLKERKVELEQELCDLQVQDDIAEIDRRVAEYRAQIEAEYASKKAEKCNDVELEIKAIDRIIKRELIKIEIAEAQYRAMAEVPVVETENTELEPTII